jgi:AcrR family transcriptional regulator
MTTVKPDQRAERWVAHRRERRASLTRTAAAAIEAAGPHVRADQIAQAAGIARPLLYRHFRDLADLHDAVLRHASQDLLEHLMPILADEGQDRAAMVAAATRCYLTWVAAHPNLTRFCLESAPPTGLLSELRRVIGEGFAARLRHELDDSQQDNFAAGIVGLAEGTATWWLENPSRDVEPLASQLARRVNALITAEAAHAHTAP